MIYPTTVDAVHHIHHLSKHKHLTINNLVGFDSNKAKFIFQEDSSKSPNEMDLDPSREKLSSRSYKIEEDDLDEYSKMDLDEISYENDDETFEISF